MARCAWRAPKTTDIFDMADFCNQCAAALGFPKGDLGYIRKDEAGNPLTLEAGYGWSELCEGCGPTVVNTEGDCIALNCLVDHHTGRSRQ